MRKRIHREARRTVQWRSTSKKKTSEPLSLSLPVSQQATLRTAAMVTVEVIQKFLNSP